MKANPRRSARPARLAAAISRDDPFGMEVEKGPGFGRVIFVFLLLHAVGIGGFAAYKWLNPDAPAIVAPVVQPEAKAERRSPARGKPPGKLDVDELLAPRRTSGTSMVVDHPEMPGYKRYRVGEGERLVEIVRQFRASVAEVEKLNGLKPGDPLFTGQWLTIPDNTGGGTAASAEATPIKAKTIDEPTENKAVTKAAIVQSKTQEKAPAEPEAKPVLPPPVIAQKPPQAGEQLQTRPPKALALKVYKVVKGDTAYSIARRHNVDLQELLRINGLSDPRQLRADQVIRIP